MASVARDGPFSCFPGIDRLLFLVRGRGMELRIDGALRRIEQRLAPCAFPGEARVDCRLLGGPVEDLNLMVDRRLVEATPRLLELAPEGPPAEVVVPVAGSDLLLAVRGALLATPPGGPPLRLDEGDALRLDGGERGRRWRIAADAAPADGLLATFAARGPAEGGARPRE